MKKKSKRLIIVGRRRSTPSPPAGVPDTSGSWEINDSTGAAQTYKGLSIEVANDGQNSTGFVDTQNGPLYGLTSAEFLRFRQEIMARGFGFYDIRLAISQWTLTGSSTDGSALETTSRTAASSAKFYVERFSGQNYLMSQVMGACGARGTFEYWSIPPGFKSTSGGANVRRTGGPSAAMLADPTEFVTNTITMMQALETAGIPLHGAALQNEPASSTGFDTTQYATGANYVTVFKAWAPAVIAQYPGFDFMNASSWDGPASGTYAPALHADGTAVGYLQTYTYSFWSPHAITTISNAPDLIRTSGNYAAADGLPVSANETWYDAQLDPLDGSYLTAAERFTRTALKTANWITYRGAQVVMPTIHAIKTLGVANNGGYAICHSRYPGDSADYSAITTYDDPVTWNAIAQGEFGLIKSIAHAVFAFLEIPKGATVYTVDQDATLVATRRVISWKTPGNKWGFMCINSSSSSTRFALSAESATSRSFTLYTYNVTTDKQSGSTVSGGSFNVDAAAWTIVVGLQSGYDSYPTFPSVTVTWGGSYTSGAIPEGSYSNITVATLSGASTYAVRSDTGSLLNISGSNLRANGSPNYEAGAGPFSAVIRATSADGWWVDTTVTYTLTNVNEAPTNISLSASTTDTSAAQGASIGALSTTDPDSGNTFTYSFDAVGGGAHGNASNKAQITGNTLQVGSAAPLSAGTFDITIKSTDQGGLTYSKDFTITVTAPPASGIPIVILTQQLGL